jgi:hypothetical protein
MKILMAYLVVALFSACLMPHFWSQRPQAQTSPLAFDFPPKRRVERPLFGSWTLHGLVWGAIALLCIALVFCGYFLASPVLLMITYWKRISKRL